MLTLTPTPALDRAAPAQEAVEHGLVGQAGARRVQVAVQLQLLAVVHPVQRPEGGRQRHAQLRLRRIQLSLAGAGPARVIYNLAL